MWTARLFRRAERVEAEEVELRWQDLIADIEGQMQAAEDEQLQGEVADRTRSAFSTVSLADRLAACRGRRLRVRVGGGQRLEGDLRHVAEEWLLLEDPPGAAILVPLESVISVTGLTRDSLPSRPSDVSRRLGLRVALRGLVRERHTVHVVLGDGGTLTGTLDRVGADHVDLAEHDPGEPRRASAVRSVTTVRLRAIAAVRQIP